MGHRLPEGFERFADKDDTMQKRKFGAWTGGILTAFILALSLSLWTNHSCPYAYDYSEATESFARCAESAAGTHDTERSCGRACGKIRA